MTTQKNYPLHGVTLQMQVEELVAHYGWEALGGQIKIKCFTDKPSVKSSLPFLRKTPWARKKVEDYYVWTFFKRDGTRKETMTKRTHPELWEACKVEAVQKLGKFSARAMQHAVVLYKEKGGGYEGDKSEHNTLIVWNKRQQNQIRSNEVL